jgi:hypothetical protein
MFEAQNESTRPFPVNAQTHHNYVTQQISTHGHFFGFLEFASFQGPLYTDTISVLVTRTNDFSGACPPQCEVSLDSENKNCRRCIRLGAECEFVTTKRTRKPRNTGGIRVPRSRIISSKHERIPHSRGGGYPPGGGEGSMLMYSPPALYPPPPPGLYSSSSGTTSMGAPSVPTPTPASVRISRVVVV